MYARPVRRGGSVLALFAVVVVTVMSLNGIAAAAPTGSAAAFASAAEAVPSYNHVFLIILENNGYGQIIGNPYAPELNALAHDYGLATNYHGVADPSEPNYVAMLGGSYFNISSDNPYWFPGGTVHSANLMSQLEGAGLTWKGYFQGMPYAGYRDYCYPAKCNGIPDADTQYVSKHNGIVNFADMQTPAEFAKEMPFDQLAVDLTAGTVANFSYIVPDECDDMHGAPPWCVDSGNPQTLQQDWLISHGDQFVGNTVNEITSSSMWGTAHNAIVVTFDEGNAATSRIATVVITSHGPRGVVDSTLANHYSLLATLEQTFGLGCLLNSCNASTLAPLFTITGAKSVPTLPRPFQFPTGPDQISPEGNAKRGAPVNLSGLTNWTVVPSVNFDSFADNDLAGISAASATDAWAVGAYYPTAAGVLATLAEHFDGTRWTGYPLPNVGTEENVLLGVSMPSPGHAWAVGYYVNGKFQQHTLIEHFNGSSWSVVPSPNPSAAHNILYGVSAVSDTDVWAVGASEKTSGHWQALVEHWNGATWQVVAIPEPGPNGNQLYAVQAVGPNNVYAVGQSAGLHFPSDALIEHWNGHVWSVLPSPSDGSATALPLGLSATRSSLTVVGQQEPNGQVYTPYVASGAPHALALQSAPSATHSENDLFGVVSTGNGSAWAVGWAVYNAPNDIYLPLILHEQNGTWSVVHSPGFGPGSTSGLESIVAIPGGGLWAVGVTASATGSFTTLIEYHP
jgi:hypothetical protein